jgi:drug/metabolite transporter (DMT)-like permease
VNERGGLAVALLGSLLGGASLAATRYAVAWIDPLAVAAFRYGAAALILFPFAFPAARMLTRRNDVAATVALGLLFFAVYPYLFALALTLTTAVHGAVAFSMMPVLTLVFAVLLGREAFSWRRFIGTFVAVGGLLLSVLGRPGATLGAGWPGDLVMVAAAGTQALYNVLSRPYLQRVGALPFTALGMVIGAPVLALALVADGTSGNYAALGGVGWLALLYLGIFGGALLWALWSIALRWAASSLVALTITVAPLTGALLGALLLGEPIGPDFAVGLAAVASGIAVASSPGRPKRVA